MKDVLVLLAHLFTTIAKHLEPGSVKAVVADSPLMKQQLLVTNRSRQPIHTMAQRIGRLLKRQRLLKRDSENSYLASDTLDKNPMD